MRELLSTVSSVGARGLVAVESLGQGRRARLQDPASTLI